MPLDLGQPAPDFTLRDQHGQRTALASFRGHQAAVVMFYPYAFSRVCSGELCEVRDAMPQFQNDDVQLLAISCDSVFTLRAFSEHDRLDYPLLSDFWPHGAVAQAYGVFDDCALRGTFVIDRAGLLRWQVVHAIPDARDLDDYRTALAELG
jgi:mycoredoxin-dependent peroxiredoxin